MNAPPSTRQLRLEGRGGGGGCKGGSCTPVLAVGGIQCAVKKYAPGGEVHCWF